MFKKAFTAACVCAAALPLASSAFAQTSDGVPFTSLDLHTFTQSEGTFGGTISANSREFQIDGSGKGSFTPSPGAAAIPLQATPAELASLQKAWDRVQFPGGTTAIDFTQPGETTSLDYAFTDKGGNDITGSIDNITLAPTVLNKLQKQVQPIIDAIKVIEHRVDSTVDLPPTPAPPAPHQPAHHGPKPDQVPVSGATFRSLDLHTFTQSSGIFGGSIGPDTSELKIDASGKGTYRASKDADEVAFQATADERSALLRAWRAVQLRAQTTAISVTEPGETTSLDFVFPAKDGSDATGSVDGIDLGSTPGNKLQRPLQPLVDAIKAIERRLDSSTTSAGIVESLR